MKLGYEMRSGEPVDVPVTHSVFSALTGGGKTEAILRLMREAEANGYTVLALDVKAKPRDFEGVGHEIRPYISESTEPLLVLRMLESVAGAGLFSRFAVILDASMDTEHLRDVKANFDAVRDNKKAWARRREDAKVLGYLAGKLLDQVQEGKYAPEVRLVEGRINVMDLSSLPLGVQQLVVDSVFRWLLAREKKVVLVLEEAINFIPQMEKVQFETTARKFIREGRSAELLLWASGQALTEMDIHIRKQMRAWVLGPQMEEREATKFMRQVPMKGVKPTEIQKLPTGHFIAAIRRTEEEGGQVEVKRVYVQPTWLPDDAAIKVAKGSWTLKDVMHFKKARPRKVVKDDMDENERKKYEADINSLRVQLDREQETRQDLLRQVKDLENRLDVQKAASGEISEAALGVRTAERATSKRSKTVDLGIDLDALAVKVADMVEPRILAKIPAGQRVEVPPPRAILQGLLGGEVERIKSKAGALNDIQKRMVAYLLGKRVQVPYGEVVRAVVGYDSGPHRKLLKALGETGLVALDSKHSRARYAGRDLVEDDLRDRYDLTTEDTERVLAAIENEFAHMVG